MMPSDVPHFPFQIGETGLFHWNEEDLEKTVETAKKILEKAKEYNKDPYLAMLEPRDETGDDCKYPAKRACWRQFW